MVIPFIIKEIGGSFERVFKLFNKDNNRDIKKYL